MLKWCCQKRISLLHTAWLDSYLSVVRYKERGRAVILHEVLGEEAHPGVISIEDYPLPGCFGLPNEVVFQQCGGI